MKALIYTVLIVITLINNVKSQNSTDPRLFPGSDTTKITPKASNQKITTLSLDFNQSKPGEVKVNKDERIQDLTKFVGTPQKGSPNVQIKGYRVQVFFDSDKDQVNQKRSDYLARHSENPAYVDYLQPNFRLRVGNFRTRLQAQRWQDEIKNDFPDAIIVEDWIDLPKLELRP